ncbi:ParB/RepB/Spo0J family partition protein [Breznakiella homolactica]|uniref:ParB/RepB/Spo0J family partition protein n=1 Tax=Breznakiella homolactica TaxID=2798577 RepID=A0A7T7XNC0_9SPIR|nr:ParB/RepB/Spo0J family partition protein [Breznakiella homolactica]QQO09403.1 ParB/RepB/Spo0J family partition protein [Breznakiella homolactica]
MAVKHGLGKGLEALIPMEDGEEVLRGPSAAGERLIPLDTLKANPGQPRTHFDEEALIELADSIREHGVIQPIIVEETEDGGYIIVAGERRSRAAKMAGLKEIPALVRNYSEQRRMEVALIENVQRADLNPMEEARAYKNLMALTGLSQDEAALRVGKNRSTVANALRLLKLPEAVQESLEAGRLTSGHARAILAVNSPADQDVLYREIIGMGISVRESERRAGELNSGKQGDPKKEPKPAPVKRDPEIAAMEEKFIEALGTKVSIQGDLQKGTIRIDYYSMDDLDRLYSILGGKD